MTTFRSPWRHAVVVGASSGIGREIVRLLARGGCQVSAVARREDRLRELESEFPDRVKALVHDVEDTASVPEAFTQAVAQAGGLDLIVYASGVMPTVGWHEYDWSKDEPMIDVNIKGAVAWLNQAALRMEGTKSGTIVGIGSVAGDRGRGGQPVYNASKAFLHSYMESLRNRLARHGVKVVTVKPGPTATEMTASLNLPNAMPAEDAAAKILQVSQRTGEHYLKLTHRVIFAVIRRIPSFLFRKLKV